MLADDLACALDAVAFARRLGLTPDPWQTRALRFSGARALWLCARQTDKSTTASVLALHRAMYMPHSLTLLVSPSLRQSSELFRKVIAGLDRLDTRPHLTEDNRLSLTLGSGSRIVSLPSSESTVRGYSAVDLIIEDEAARVPDDLHIAIRPMLATSNGQLILMTTPAGQRGHFYDAWEKGQGWDRISVRADECPRIPPAFLATERLALGERWYRQEYEVGFEDMVGAVFPAGLIRSAIDANIAPFTLEKPYGLHHRT